MRKALRLRIARPILP